MKKMEERLPLFPHKFGESPDPYKTILANRIQWYESREPDGSLGAKIVDLAIEDANKIHKASNGAVSLDKTTVEAEVKESLCQLMGREAERLAQFEFERLRNRLKKTDGSTSEVSYFALAVSVVAIVISILVALRIIS